MTSKSCQKEFGSACQHRPFRMAKESSVVMLADLNLSWKNPFDIVNILSLTLESYVDRILRKTDNFC